MCAYNSDITVIKTFFSFFSIAKIKPNQIKTSIILSFFSIAICVYLSGTCCLYFKCPKWIHSSDSYLGRYFMKLTANVYLGRRCLLRSMLIGDFRSIFLFVFSSWLFLKWCSDQSNALWLYIAHSEDYENPKLITVELESPSFSLQTLFLRSHWATLFDTDGTGPRTGSSWILLSIFKIITRGENISNTQKYSMKDNDLVRHQRHRNCDGTINMHYLSLIKNESAIVIFWIWIWVPFVSRRICTILGLKMVKNCFSASSLCNNSEAIVGQNLDTLSFIPKHSLAWIRPERDRFTGFQLSPHRNLGSQKNRMVGWKVIDVFLEKITYQYKFFLLLHF